MRIVAAMIIVVIHDLTPLNALAMPSGEFGAACSAENQKESSTATQPFLIVFSPLKLLRFCDLRPGSVKASVVELDDQLNQSRVVAGGGDAAEVSGLENLPGVRIHRAAAGNDGVNVADRISEVHVVE